MLSFRQKIILNYALVFLLFITLLFPFSAYLVRIIVAKTLADRTSELVSRIQNAPDNDALVSYLKDQKALLFFRVSIITDEYKILYDSHTKRLLGPSFSQEYVVNHPEVIEAFNKGTGSHEDYSELLDQRFVYLAQTFDFHGKTYVMRTAFPYSHIAELTRDFQFGFLGLSIVVLLLFSTMTWFIIHRLVAPIQQIITAVKPYQDNLQASIPEIIVKSSGSSDEFVKLANTLNSLSTKIRKHISSLTHERNEKRTILESLIEGVIAIDSNMTMTFANKMAQKFLGFEEENLLGKCFSITNQQPFFELLANCQKEKIALTKTISIQNDNQKLYLDVIASPKNDDSGAILVIQDKSTHYRLMEMKKDFVANASHELKTPITIIRGFAEALYDNPDLPRTTTVEITDKIVRNCQRMTTLIKDLLTLTDIEHIPENRLMDCDLYDLLENCQNSLQNIFPTASITLSNPSGDPINVIGDASLIELAFMNLIENGAKYSNSPAEITVTFEHEDQWVKVIIADKGIGIPEASLENIFERFYTVNKAHSRKMGGSGLGLSIVKTVIEKHFGKIIVTSKIGVGTSFTVLLPRKISNE
jgi:two-component system, OmpR family, phosphate regulon sensor histidine kinase PhoR